MPLQQDIRFCTSADGVKIATTSTGSGFPLVRAGTWLSHLDCDARHEEPQAYIRALSKGYTFVRYDSRGCGLSDRKIPSLTFEDGIKDLEAVVAAHGLKRFALFGLSMGAATSIAYAIRHPEQVSHLVASYLRPEPTRSDGCPEKCDHGLTPSLHQPVVIVVRARSPSVG